MEKIFQTLQYFNLWLFKTGDFTRIVYFRIAFGAMMVWEVARFLLSGKVERYYIQPEFMFAHYGFEWVKPMSAPVILILYSMLGLASVCILLGLFYRIATLLFFFIYSYFFLLDDSRYLNHYYLIIMFAFLMIFIPAHCQYSLDAKRRPEIRRTHALNWHIFILQFMITIPYFFGGIAKLNMDWISGEPLREWLSFNNSSPFLKDVFQGEWAPLFLSWSGIIIDIFIIPAVLWKKTRWIAFAIISGFHLINSQLFSIGVFPWLMLTATLILFIPEWKVFWTTKKETVSVKNDHNKTLTLVFILSFMAFHLFIPLRHWLYPGDVSWTEEGHKFSWHMKLRSKTSKAIFYAYFPESRKKIMIQDSGILLKHQRSAFSDYPDRIIRYSKYLKHNLYPDQNVQIRATVIVSLNGRPFALMMDSTADLASTPITLKHNPVVLLSYPAFPPKGQRLYEISNQSNE